MGSRADHALSRLLRHDAGAAGLPMDAAGWVPVAAVLAHLRLSQAELEAVVATNNKQRLQLEGDRVRCCQGHSTAGMPVTHDALEASWMAWQPANLGARLWHGTRLEALDAIHTTGLSAQARTHVHLAEALDSTVGKRAQVAVMLAVDPARLAAAGLGVWRAPNGVVLARTVPRACIVGIRPMTRAAQAIQAALEATFGPA